MVTKNQNTIIKIIDFYSIKNNFHFEFLNLIYYFKHHFAINNKIKLVFWHNTNIEKSKLIKKVYRNKSFFNIFLINNTNKFKINLNKKINFYIGDTDVFINLNKNI